MHACHSILTISDDLASMQLLTLLFLKPAPISSSSLSSFGRHPGTPLPTGADFSITEVDLDDADDADFNDDDDDDDDASPQRVSFSQQSRKRHFSQKV